MVKLNPLLCTGHSNVKYKEILIEKTINKERQCKYYVFGLYPSNKK
jgi:hypothetical protein